MKRAILALFMVGCGASATQQLADRYKASLWYPDCTKAPAGAKCGMTDEQASEHNRAVEEEHERARSEQARYQAEANERAAKKRQEAAIVVAASMRGAADGMARTQPNSNCMNDYGCPIGRACVKAQGALNGTCMQTVSVYGTPTYHAPNPNSTQQGAAQCDFSHACPLGFSCVGGQCLR